MTCLILGIELMIIVIVVLFVIMYKKYEDRIEKLSQLKSAVIKLKENNTITKTVEVIEELNGTIDTKKTTTKTTITTTDEKEKYNDSKDYTGWKVLLTALIFITIIIFLVAVCYVYNPNPAI